MAALDNGDIGIFTGAVLVRDKVIAAGRSPGRVVSGRWNNPVEAEPQE
jgi:hypothetical protein